MNFESSEPLLPSDQQLSGMKYLIAQEINKITQDLSNLPGKNALISEEINKINQELIGLLTSSEIMAYEMANQNEAIMSINQVIASEINVLDMELTRLPEPVLEGQKSPMDVYKAMEVLDLLLQPSEN